MAIRKVIKNENTIENQKKDVVIAETERVIKENKKVNLLKTKICTKGTLKIIKKPFDYKEIINLKENSLLAKICFSKICFT
jgi:hypothetical protein